MMLLGLLLIVIGWVTGIHILVTLGVILLIIGAILWVFGASGHSVGSRNHYW